MVASMTSLPSRRSILMGGLALGCAAMVAPDAGVQEIAPGVFVRRGLDAEATADNRDAIANIGFIVGGRSVMVTESGGSLADGRWLRGEIRKRTTKPISHVVISHAHPDHCFGAGAFAADKPVVVGHQALRGELAARGDYYRARLAEVMPEADVGPVVMPTLEIADTAEADLGGRKVRFTAHQRGHSSCDLSFLDAGSGLLFPADILFVGRVPSLDGSLKGWLAEIAQLKASGAARAVPGHGPPVVDAAPALADLERYLINLRDETRRAIAAGKSMQQAVDTAGTTERANWRLFDDYNGRNVIQAYKELEWE
jgi:quinoprotein relay system zinc metallohydrolase 2